MNNPLDQYINVLCTLQHNNLQTLDSVTSQNVTFQDPFNLTHNREDLKKIFEEMFQNLQDISFNVSNKIQSENTGFITWTFSGNSKLTGNFIFEGSSMLVFDNKGMVISHRDYWDASELMEKLPLVKILIKSLRKKLGTN